MTPTSQGKEPPTIPGRFILLEAEALVAGHEGVILTRAGIEERAIVEIGPPPLMDGVHCMPLKHGRQMARKIRVEHDAHATS